MPRDRVVGEEHQQRRENTNNGGRIPTTAGEHQQQRKNTNNGGRLSTDLR
jgi:hypothetical protein